MADKKTILIVEDDQFLRDLLAKKLIDEGFEVETAIDGQEGLEKIRQVKPSLILLDIMLPTIDGFEIMRQIKQGNDKTVMNIPVVMLTNLGQESDIQKGKELGAVDYLVKANFTTDEIIQKVRNVLG